MLFVQRRASLAFCFLSFFLLFLFSLLDFIFVGKGARDLWISSCIFRFLFVCWQQVMRHMQQQQTHTVKGVPITIFKSKQHPRRKLRIETENWDWELLIFVTLLNSAYGIHNTNSYSFHWLLRDCLLTDAELEIWKCS